MTDSSTIHLDLGFFCLDRLRTNSVLLRKADISSYISKRSIAGRSGFVNGLASVDQKPSPNLFHEVVSYQLRSPDILRPGSSVGRTLKLIISACTQTCPTIFNCSIPILVLHSSQKCLINCICLHPLPFARRQGDCCNTLNNQCFLWETAMRKESQSEPTYSSHPHRVAALECYQRFVVR